MSRSIDFPDPAEQRKIAGCLGSLDAWIAAEGRKLAALRTHKRGLMQQLFPPPNQTHPPLRFPEFQNAGEWEAATVGERCNAFSGGTPSTSNKAFYGGGIPFIRSAEIGQPQTALTLTQQGLEESAAKLVEHGDLLVALYGANSGDAALAGTSGAINQAILCLHTEGSTPFLYHFLTERKAWIISTYLQGGQGNLSGEIVKSVPLSFPAPAEQHRIADCLAALDTRIAAQAAKLDALAAHKRGLMQQLFPLP